jgi:putative toxin-antitoxin system antitoxin component (TIGR02293 family)
MLEQQTVEVLGGRRALGQTIHSQLEMAELVVKGLPRKAARAVQQRLEMSERELALSLGVNPKTLQRQAKSEIQRLNRAQGDRLYRLARIVAFAENVFEDRDRAHFWLREPQRGLGNRVPLALLQSEAGTREVEDLLGRIEFGVFS